MCCAINGYNHCMRLILGSLMHNLKCWNVLIMFVLVIKVSAQNKKKRNY